VKKIDVKITNDDVVMIFLVQACTNKNEYNREDGPNFKTFF